MTYTITITKNEQKDYVQKEYKKIADTGNKTDGQTVYGYVTTDSTKIVETTVLKQTVDELDLTSVIKAINGIK